MKMEESYCRSRQVVESGDKTSVAEDGARGKLWGQYVHSPEVPADLKSAAGFSWPDDPSFCKEK